MDLQRTNYVVHTGAPISRLLLAAALLALAHPAAARELPSPFSATYVGRPYLFGRADTTIGLERVGDYFKYTLSTEGRLVGYRNTFYECSVVALREGRLYPLEYRHTDQKSPSHSLSARFDWNAGTATVTRGDGEQTRIADLAWPVWDPLSLQIAIMTDLLNGDFGAERTYRLLGRHGVSERHLRIERNERIDTKNGVIDAVRVARADGGAEQFWFASKYRYVPARIQLKSVQVDLVSDPAKVLQEPRSESGSRPGC